MGQLPLTLGLKPSASLDGFVGGANRAAVEHVRAVALGQRPDSVWLLGPAGTGKSHLLTGACRAAAEAGFRPMYLAAGTASDPAALAGLEGIDLLALDDLDRVAGDPAWEAALFPAVNARQERGGLLFAAARAPRDCGFLLPDLVSRLGAAPVYRLKALNDDELRLAVSRQASMRGLVLDDAAASYLLQRVSRDLGELAEWLDRIDRFSLAAKRRVTIPLLREVLEARPPLDA